MSEVVVNLYEAKSRLSALVERAAAGEEIIIAKAGHPKARLVPFQRAKQLREPGGWEGKVWVADDFDEPLPPDILNSVRRGGMRHSGRLLLDTHVFIWWRVNSPLLGRDARAAIASADLVFVSVASAWEAAHQDRAWQAAPARELRGGRDREPVRALADRLCTCRGRWIAAASP